MNPSLASIEIVTPGCFGHASIFKHSNPICKACGGFTQCEEKVAQKLAAFNKRADLTDHVIRHQNGSLESGAKTSKIEAADIDVNVVPERNLPIARVKRVLTEEENKMLESMPVKVRVEAKRLMNYGLLSVVKSNLQAGINPFPFEGKKFLHVACRLLLAGGFTKASLRGEYMTQLGWTESTSFSHVSMALSILQSIDAIMQVKDKFVIKEN